LGDQLKKNDVAKWRRVEEHAEFWWRNLRDRNHFEYPGVDGRIIVRWIYRKWNLGGGGLD
jgi:hypothetical protein